MEFRRNEPGIYVSAAVHIAVLAFSLVAFSSTQKFEDAQESIPVEMITESEMNQIMKGEKTAKPTDTKPKVDEKSEKAEQRPTPPIAEAKRDVPTPPPPLKRIPDPADDDVPEPPKVAVLPPPRPAPEVKPEPEPAPTPPTPPVRPPQPKAEPKPEPPKPVVKEAAEPPPPPPQRPKPEPQKQAEAKPEPEESEPAPLPPRRPPALRKVEDKPKPDQLAKLEESTRDVKPTPRPRSGEENNEPQRKYDPSAISELLSKEPPQARRSTGPTPANRQANLGAPSASAPKMSPSMSAQLNGMLIEQYKRCWTYIGNAQGSQFQPQVSVSYSQSGGLVGRPSLRNRPTDPALQSLADSALRAVQRCNPLQIPAQYMPYYNEWKDLILRFDPNEMSG